jgi:hypothetical protein
VTYEDAVIGIDYPPGWVELPMDPEVPARPWAEELVAEQPGLLPVERREAAVVDLVVWVEECRLREPELAFAYRPDPLAPTVAVCEVVAMPAEDPPVTPEIAATLFARPQPGTVGDVIVDRRILPAGPAVRMRQMNGEAGGVKPAPEGPPLPVVEGVTWVIFPPGLDGLIFVTTTWTELVLGDDLAELADRMAEGISLDV